MRKAIHFVKCMVSPEPYAVLYDGRCAFCTGQSRKLVAMARPGALRLVDFQQPGALEEFPNLDHETCMQAIHLIMPDGRTFRGFEAIVQALATRAILRWAVQLYYLPGARQLCEWIYRWIARNRYRLIRQAVDRGECPGGACALHAEEYQG